MPVTFGSVGDIIAICLLVKDCADALSEVKGAPASYQAVVRELWILEKALLQVDLLARTYVSNADLNEIFESAKTTVEGCRNTLDAFKNKIRRYDGHLGQNANISTSRKIFAGSALKLLWQISTKDEAARFRVEVVAYSLSINQLLATATMLDAKANYDRLSDRVEESQRLTSTSLAGQDQVLREIIHRLKDVDRRISSTESLAAGAWNWMNQLGADLKSRLQKIYNLNLATHNSVLEIERRLLPAGTLLSPLINDPVFYLEDAIGRIFPVGLGFIKCWDAFYFVLETHFEGMQGVKKIKKREFVLQDRATKRDIDLSKKWERVFLPGQFIDMSMVFQELVKANASDEDMDTCPKCHTNSNQPRGLEIRCWACKLTYKRVSDEDEPENGADTSKVSHVHAPDAPDSLVNSAPNIKKRPMINPVPPSNLKKRKREKDGEDDLTEFTRIRLIQKKRRLNDEAVSENDTLNKRKLHDIMDIDSESDSPKRHRPSVGEDTGKANGEGNTQSNFSQEIKSENAQAAEIESKIKDWTRDPKDFNFGNDDSDDNPWAYRKSTSESKDTKADTSYFYYTRSDRDSSPYYAYYDDGVPSYRSYYSPRYSTSPSRQQAGPAFAEYYDSNTKPTRPGRAAHSARSEPKPRPQPAAGRAQPPKATEEDARRAGIPAGYSLKNWDPTEEPIMLLGSVFDANSLGKWIYDWTIYYYGPATPLAEMAGEQWLLLIQLAGKLKRAKEVLPKIRQTENKEMVEDFLESGERVWTRFAKLLKVCETYMWKTMKEENGDKRPTSMGGIAGCEFVDTIFGRDREFEKTEKLMTGMRLWSMRFDANCDDIMRHPTQ